MDIKTNLKYNTENKTSMQILIDRNVEWAQSCFVRHNLDACKMTKVQIFIAWRIFSIAKTVVHLFFVNAMLLSIWLLGILFNFSRSIIFKRQTTEALFSLHCTHLRASHIHTIWFKSREPLGSWQLDMLYIFVLSFERPHCETIVSIFILKIFLTFLLWHF